jgi:hypothetical protein
LLGVALLACLLAAAVVLLMAPGDESRADQTISALGTSDPMTVEDETEVWGGPPQVTGDSYVELIRDGDGDRRPQGNGEPQPNSDYRRLHLVEGAPDPSGTERVELGANESRYGSAGGEGTFALLEPGKTYDIWYSERLDPDYPISNINWSSISQIKQTQPYAADDADGDVVGGVEARAGRFEYGGLGHAEDNPWFTWRPTLGTWFRIHERIYCSPNEDGWFEIEIDDRPNATTFVPQHQSGRKPGRTIVREAGTGRPIPNHLRLGLYRNAVIDGDTWIDVGNVQVYEVPKGRG